MNRSYSSPRAGRVVRQRVAAIAGLLISALGTAFAGEPIFYAPDGRPVGRDPSQPVRYSVDLGMLGTRTNATASAIVDRAFHAWANVPTAQVQVQSAGKLSRDVTGATVLNFLNGLPSSDPSPVLFDNDGTILDKLFGVGSSQHWLGLTQPLWSNARTGQLLQCLTILNGPLHAPNSDTYLYSTAVHELGHLFGLDHSQINGDKQFDGDPTNDGLAPVMSYFRGPNDDGSLSRDDQAWFSFLYPNASFLASVGTIRGRVLLPDGVTGLRGINVIARRDGDPDVTAISAFSGDIFLSLGTGVTDPARLGDFMIPGLPPGSYRLELQQLDAGTPQRVPATYLSGGEKFWREGSSAQDAPTASTPILVNAGQEVKGVDIVVNGDSLGEPKPVAEVEPNELPNGQRVTLPAIISGQVEDGPADAAQPPIADSALTAQMQDVYRVTLGDYTTVTAILTAVQPGANLDLYLIGVDSTGPYTKDLSAEAGTPPETIQFRLPPGRWYFGVHRAGSRGSAYSLRLLASPSPEPDTGPNIAYVSYLLLGDVTPTSATARWQTTSDSPSVIYYNLPKQEIGSAKREQEHALSLTDLAAGSHTEVDVISQAGSRPDQIDGVSVTLATASPPDAAGAPRMVVTSKSTLLYSNLAEVVVKLTNAGDGDALKVHIDQITLAAGWEPLSYAAGLGLPTTLDLGGIGSGGVGYFVVRILQTSGSTAAKVTVKGSYTDAAGNVTKF